MNDEKDVVKDFLNEITEPRKIFKEDKAEEVVEEEARDEKPLPFHKDPKVQRYVERQIEKALKDVKPAEREFRKEVEDIKLPASFIKLVGNDTPEKLEVLRDLSTYFGNLKGEARQEFLEDIKKQEQQAKQEDEAAVRELENGFEQIAEDYGIDLDTDRKTRAAFVEFLRKVSPKNEDGEVKQFADIPAAWETFQERNKTQPSRAKELAARSMARSGEAASQGATRPASWAALERQLSKKT